MPRLTKNNMLMYGGLPCCYHHPATTSELRSFIPDELFSIYNDLKECKIGNCFEPDCPLSFRSNDIDSFRRVSKTQDRIYGILAGLNIMVPAMVGGIYQTIVPSMQQQTIIQPMIQQSSRSTVVRNVQVQPEVQTTVIEEHIHQPDPIHFTETRTIVHQGGRTYEAGRTNSVTHGDSSSRTHGKASSSRKHRTSSPDVEEYSGDDGGHGRSNKSSGGRLIEDRGESRHSDHHHRHRSRTRSRSRSRSRDHGRYSSRSRDHDRHSKGHRSRERNTHQSSGRRVESPREYDYWSSSSSRSN